MLEWVGSSDFSRVFFFLSQGSINALTTHAWITTIKPFLNQFFDFEDSLSPLIVLDPIGKISNQNNNSPASSIGRA